MKISRRRGLQGGFRRVFMRISVFSGLTGFMGSRRDLRGFIKKFLGRFREVPYRFQRELQKY